MKVIDRSIFRDEDGAISLNDRLRGTWQFGISWNKELQAQDKLIGHLNILLDNNYTLIRDILLPGLEIPVPMVLIGPSGVRFFYASGLKGIYRAKEKSWLVLDSRSRAYRLSQPNLIKRAALMTHAVHTYLINKGHQVEKVEPVLFFANPSIHVDTLRPAVRIVLIDGADRYIENLIQAPEILDSILVKRISDSLGEVKPGPSTPMSQSTLRIGSLQMLRWQWLVLGILGLLQLCAMLIFIILVFLVT